MAFDYKYVQTDGLPFIYQVAMGKIQWAYAINVIGANNSVPMTNQEMIWQAAGIEALHANAERVELVTTSDQDKPAGSGAHTVQIWGLDDNFNYIQETITLDGTTPVLSALSYRRFIAGDVITSGATKAFVGTPSVTQTTSGELMGTSTLGSSELRKVYYPIPAGFYGLILGWQTSQQLPNSQVSIRLSARDEVTGIIKPFDNGQTGGIPGNYVNNFNPPILLPPKTELFATGAVLGGTAPVLMNANIQMILIREDMVVGNHNIFGSEP